MNKTRARILLVDDSRSDQIIVQRALEDGEINVDLVIANNGQEALNILRNEGPYHKAHFVEPHLILLDINMPVMDGIDTLKKIRKDEKLKHIPVVILTTSARDKDVIESYQAGVNAFLTKPVGYAEFISVIRQLEYFWFELAALPLKREKTSIS